MPWPGVVQARAPVAWYDSLGCGHADAGDGWNGAAVSADGRPVVGDPRARSVFTMGSGSSGLDETAVTLERGDSLSGFGVEAMGGTRGAQGGVERLGRHVWDGRARLARGAYHFGGTIGQRGAAARLSGGEEQAVRGQSGSVECGWTRAGRYWSADFARSLDRHESFGSLAFSERAAQETRLGATAGLERGPRRVETRVVWSQAEVHRAGYDAFSRSAGSIWAVTRAAAPAAGGKLELAIGAGRHGALDRFDVAPSASFRRRLGRFGATVRVERVLTPVWTDLASGYEPFLQHAWTGGAQFEAGGGGPWRARVGASGGRVYARALADRLPLEEMWLRSGLRPEPGTYDFALAEGGIERSGRRFDAGLEGFGLAHRSTPAPAGLAALRSDPDAGLRAWLGGRARFFHGDLGVGLRGEAAGVGDRQGGTSEPWDLPAYVTFSVLGEISIGDVVAVWRVSNLEDRPRAASWRDRSTGLPAVEGRRELQMRVVWRLFD
jgi:hypothetical protein